MEKEWLGCPLEDGHRLLQYELAGARVSGSGEECCGIEIGKKPKKRNHYKKAASNEEIKSRNNDFCFD